MTILKPRLAKHVAMIMGGAFISLLLVAFAVAVDEEVSLLPALAVGFFALLGIFLVTMGTIALRQRNKLAIIIDETGIAFPRGDSARPDQDVHILRNAIVHIGKSESLRGRVIEVTLTTGAKVTIQARNYCDLDAFLKHCEKHGLPAS